MEATSERQLKDDSTTSTKSKKRAADSKDDAPLLSVAAILSAHDVEYKTVEVKEWGGAVRLKQLTGAENVEFQAIIDGEQKSGPGKRQGIDLLLLRKTLVDEKGHNLLQSKDDFEAFRQKSGRIIRRLAVIALDFNGLNDPARDARLAAKRLRLAADGERDDIAERLNEIADELVRETEDDDLLNS